MISTKSLVMKTNIFLALAFSILGTITAHAAPLTVAVYDFKGNGPAASYGNNVTTLVTADLTTETNLILVERSELNKALSEQAFGASGMVSSDAAAKIGQITGAKVLVAGQVIETGKDHLIIVANIIGTETGRLFADKVEGAPDNLTGMTLDLSRKIAQTIGEQATNLVLPPPESSAVRIDRIVKMITGANRPSVSIDITGYNRWGNKWPESSTANALGLVLMKAGFPVVDESSDTKPDIIITGSVTWDTAKQHGSLFACSATMELKATERRTGVIRVLDHQESTGTGI